MPTATDSTRPQPAPPQRSGASRRRALQRMAALAASPLVARSGDSRAGVVAQGLPPRDRTTLAATWREADVYYAGLLATTPDGIGTLHREALPTRAHGIVVEPQGTVLVASRRPGDWLLRFDPWRQAALAWCWSDGEYCFNGHVVASGDGRRLFSTETSLETGAGSVGVRDAASFELVARWPTAGIDPHELVLGVDGSLWIANGGIETRPETGRTKHHLERMDSSLVRLDAASGRITGQWRLQDRRLGLRHLAFAADGTLGIALQAEHDDPEEKRSAPILALWQRHQGLRAVALPEGVALAGYGGAIARVGEGFGVSCPRADRVACWQLVEGEPGWSPPVALEEACALAQGWCGGLGAVLHAGTGGSASAERWSLPPAIRLDNHWALTGTPAG